ELFHLSVPPIELLGDQKEVRDVPPSEGKVRDRSIRLPLVRTDIEVVFEPERVLVPLLGSLGEELHDDPRERPRNRGLDLGGRGRRLCVVLYGCRSATRRARRRASRSPSGSPLHDSSARFAPGTRSGAPRVRNGATATRAARRRTGSKGRAR